MKLEDFFASLILVVLAIVFGLMVYFGLQLKTP